MIAIIISVINVIWVDDLLRYNVLIYLNYLFSSVTVVVVVVVLVVVVVDIIVVVSYKN